jgi:hypothetical protein
MLWGLTFTQQEPPAPPPPPPIVFPSADAAVTAVEDDMVRKTNHTVPKVDENYCEVVAADDKAKEEVMDPAAVVRRVVSNAEITTDEDRQDSNGEANKTEEEGDIVVDAVAAGRYKLPVVATASTETRGNRQQDEDNNNGSGHNNNDNNNNPNPNHIFMLQAQIQTLHRQLQQNFDQPAAGALIGKMEALESRLQSTMTLAHQNLRSDLQAEIVGIQDQFRSLVEEQARDADEVRRFVREQFKLIEELIQRSIDQFYREETKRYEQADRAQKQRRFQDESAKNMARMEARLADVENAVAQVDELRRQVATQQKLLHSCQRHLRELQRERDLYREELLSTMGSSSATTMITTNPMKTLPPESRAIAAAAAARATNATTVPTATTTKTVKPRQSAPPLPPPVPAAITTMTATPTTSVVTKARARLSEKRQQAFKFRETLNNLKFMTDGKEGGAIDGPHGSNVSVPDGNNNKNNINSNNYKRDSTSNMATDNRDDSNH